MQANRSRDTGPEIALRSALHAHGLRFRKNLRVEVPGVKVRIDVAFPARRIAVFVDGCWWHGCPQHMTWPKANAEWWRSKIEANQQRDQRVTHGLAQAGWTVIRLWEHEPIDGAAERVRAAVERATLQPQ